MKYAAKHIFEAENPGPQQLQCCGPGGMLSIFRSKTNRYSA